MAKYDSLRKLERNRLLRQYKDENPNASLAEIGRLFNITPQRVWEILSNDKKKQATEITTVA